MSIHKKKSTSSRAQLLYRDEEGQEDRDETSTLARSDATSHEVTFFVCDVCMCPRVCQVDKILYVLFCSRVMIYMIIGGFL